MKYINGFIYSAYSLLIIVVLCFPKNTCGQPLSQKKQFTRQDTLRGTITPERAWWNVTHYNLQVTPDYNSKSIKGWNQIGFEATVAGPGKKMQIDLQEPMVIDSILFNRKKISSFTREGNVYYIHFGDFNFKAAKEELKKNVIVPFYSISIYFHGTPRAAKNAPWDGGWVWSKDAKGRPWMTVACQGLGASVWYPCKDHQSDEPEQGALIQVKVPDTLVAVANGRLYSKDDQKDGTMLYTWQVKNPINNYNIVPYIGKYVHFSDNYLSEASAGSGGHAGSATHAGPGGSTGSGGERNLSLDYWVLDYNLEKAKKQFGRDVKPMLKAFEHWFGPYPFYEDGFKLVESSHLGMEHQSGIAYGNRYRDGYLGSDLSGSGWGMKWDYIIVHEAGHEWFGNNITTNDVADMWVHEGFTMYSEPLFIEYHWGKKAADEYVLGIRRNISNDKPLIGPYGVNQEGSGDMYNKGANLLHTIRAVINDDSLFREIMRGLNSDFYHRTVTTKDVEDYISKKAGKDFSKVFDQYLRTTMIPVLEYKLKDDKLSYRWNNTVDGFNMPVALEADKLIWLKPTSKWQEIKLPAGTSIEQVNKDFYITLKKHD